MPARAIIDATSTATKLMVVLANSQRSLNRCIAGRELVLHAGSYRLGGWLRPVSDSGDGELRVHERCLEDGSEVEILDLVEIPVHGAALLPEQPENWSVSPDRRWRRVRRMGAELLPFLIDWPEDLWLEPGMRKDRVGQQWLLDHPPAQSLYLIRPERLCLHLEHFVPIFGQPVRKYRAIFRYCGVDYNLSLTDPRIRQRYAQEFPALGYQRTIELDEEAQYYLCISLARAWNGCHYKLVAALIDAEDYP